MAATRKQRDELTKLRILQVLSNPPDAARGGATASEIGDALFNIFPSIEDDWKQRQEAHRQIKLEDRWRLLPEMQQAGLVTRQEAPEADGKSRPYFITDKGRQYLEEARQRATSFEPGQRQGWADGISIDKQRALAEFIGQLPEFRDSDEARIREVTGQLRQLTERLSQTPGQQR